MRFLTLLTALPLAAQISSPQLGFVGHRGELRRIEGLAQSSRLSAPIAGLPACSRLDAASRFALCTNAEGVKVIDTQTFSTRTIASYERIVWSPNGSTVALDAEVHDLLAAKSARVEGVIAAVSDAGSVAVRDAQGALRLRGEIVATTAFDDEALLVAVGTTVHRIDPGRSAQQYSLAFEPSLLASDASAFYAANARAIARIDRATAEVTVYEVPADDVVITRLDRLTGGSLLLASPGENQPGWLFRDGRFSFIPGIAVKEQEVSQ